MNEDPKKDEVADDELDQVSGGHSTYVPQPLVNDQNFNQRLKTKGVADVDGQGQEGTSAEGQANPL